MQTLRQEYGIILHGSLVIYGGMIFIRFSSNLYYISFCTVMYELPKNETGKFDIFDMMGKKLFTYSLNSGKNLLAIIEDAFKQGIYFYMAFVGNKKIASDKIVIIK